MQSYLEYLVIILNIIFKIAPQNGREIEKERAKEYFPGFLANF